MRFRFKHHIIDTDLPAVCYAQTLRESRAGLPSSDRIRAMGAIGVSIGIAFAVGMIFGPTVAVKFGVPMLFWLTAILSAVGALYVALFIPKVSSWEHHEDVEWTGGQTGVVLHHPSLLRLDVGIFFLHTLVTALFVVGPKMLEAHVPLERCFLAVCVTPLN